MRLMESKSERLAQVCGRFELVRVLHNIHLGRLAGWMTCWHVEFAAFEAADGVHGEASSKHDLCHTDDGRSLHY